MCCIFVTFAKQFVRIADTRISIICAKIGTIDFFVYEYSIFIKVNWSASTVSDIFCFATQNRIFPVLVKSINNSPQDSIQLVKVFSILYVGSLKNWTLYEWRRLQYSREDVLTPCTFLYVAIPIICWIIKWWTLKNNLDDSTNANRLRSRLY